MSEKRITTGIAIKFLESIAALNDKELNLALAEARGLGNCWWVERSLKDAMIEVMENEMSLRDEAAKAEASK